MAALLKAPQAKGQKATRQAVTGNRASDEAGDTKGHQIVASGRAEWYLVERIAGLHELGKPDPKWFRDRDDAIAEVKRRLGLERLHEGKRLHDRKFKLGERSDDDGHTWRYVHAYQYEQMPQSHPDFGRSGGVRLYLMERDVEPFDPTTLFK